MRRVRLGRLHADAVDFTEALDAIEDLTDSGGGFVVTPNVDHLVRAEMNPWLRRAYGDAALSLADGTPLLWLARLAGTSLPAKVSGSDLIRPLMRRAAQNQWRVYFLGSAPETAARAREVLTAEIPGLHIVGTDSPPMGFERDPMLLCATLRRMCEAKANVILVALGCPKQEILMQRWRWRVAPAVMVGIGAGLDFIAGHKRRAPAWMARVGLEWLHRLLQEPRRLAGRYLVRDLGIIPIALRTLWQRIAGGRLRQRARPRLHTGLTTTVRMEERG